MAAAEDKTMETEDMHTSASLNHGPPREDLIETAVKFLNNPKVAPSPMYQKKAFLEKKGLTNAEIDIAINRAGTFQNDASKSVIATNFQPYQSAPYYQSSVPVSRWSKFINEIWYNMIVIGGTFCGACVLSKQYIIPYFWGLPTDKEKVDNQEKQMNIFGQSIAQLQKSFDELQTIVRENLQKHENINSIKEYEQTMKKLESQLGEVRSEITSIKGLLLNRHQFPAVPNVNPVIPTWQLEKSEVKESQTNDVSEEESESEA